MSNLGQLHILRLVGVLLFSSASVSAEERIHDDSSARLTSIEPERVSEKVETPKEVQGLALGPRSNPYQTENSAEESKAPTIIPPRIIQFEEPVYPPQALAEGLEAVVYLKITVNTDGSVSAPELVESPGHGFGEAALKAVSSLRFSPAIVGGVPRQVRIGFEYPFSQGEKNSKSKTPLVISPGEISGQVLLSGPETPLPGVEIMILDPNGPPMPLVTDSEGRFYIKGLLAGTYRVQIHPEGFIAVDSQERVFSGEATEITFRILPQSTDTEVYVHGERPPREVTRRVIERREIQRIPGTSGDALRSIQSLPGVARPPGLAGFLIVRGSAPQDTGVFIDGSQVPLAYHFGGLSSVVPTELIDQLDFYPGNFSVRYGRFNGGIVNVALRKPNVECYGDFGAPTDKEGCYHGMAQVDMIDGRLMLQGPVPGTNNWSFALAGRRSWVDAWVRPVLESAGSNVTQAPVYHDYQAIVERNLGPDDKLSFRLYGSGDDLEIILANPAAEDPGFGGNLSYGTTFVKGQVLYQKALTSKTNLDTMLSFGREMTQFSLGGNLKFDLENFPIDFRTEFGHQVHERAKVNAGFDFQTGFYNVFVRAPPPPREGESSPGPLATRVPMETDSEGIGFRPAWYADVEWQPTQRLLVVPGFRFDYARDSGHTNTNPRLAARYSLFLPEDKAWAGKSLGTVLKGGVGKFTQPPQFSETDPVFGTPGTASNRSMHYTVGFEQEFTPQVELSMEGYYKHLYDTVSRAPGPTGALVYGNDGSGRVLGLETLLKYKPDARFFGWVSYTLSQSLRRDCETCELRAFQYDQTHNLIMLGSYRLGRGWEFGARYRVVSGPLVTPVRSPETLPSIFSGDAGTYIPLQGESHSERMPLFHQLDLRLDKSWQLRTWKMSTYIDVQNVYNNAAAESYVYNFNYSQKAYQTGLPILPSLGVRGEF